ncbi:MAG: PadR family transcriptional regulator [Oscillibacter sp.]|nr:PadR family transcriptional regulator [Oscillibacter sp.]
MLKKDLLELCLLHLMAQGDQYGYDLLRQLHAAFPDTQESAIYAILRGLCRGSFTERCQGEASGGPERKYYRLTEAGSARYGDLLASWRGLREALSALGIQ